MNQEGNIYSNMENGNTVLNNQTVINEFTQGSNVNTNYQTQNLNTNKKRIKICFSIIVVIILIMILGIILYICLQDNNGNYDYQGELSEYVTEIIDGVPIPKGFVASQASGENKKNSGLVIYEGTEPVTDKNVGVSKKTRNQFVWIPVENFNDFVRKSYKINTSEGSLLEQWLTNKLTNEIYTYAEIELDNTNMPVDNQNTDYVSIDTLNEVKNMYRSVKEYGGFYVARYEAGTTFNSKIDSENDLYFQSLKYPVSYAYWNESVSQNGVGAIEKSRSVYTETDENYGVVSTLMYGVQWDTTIEWLKETSNINLIDSTNYGNYAYSELTNFIAQSKYNYSGSPFRYYSTYEYGDDFAAVISGKETKKAGDVWILTTGASEDAKVNNIYDMAGNVSEFTMEYSSDGDNIEGIVRGGQYYDAGKYIPISNRVMSRSCSGFRIALYIKPNN